LIVDWNPVEYFACPYLETSVELTPERERHILVRSGAGGCRRSALDCDRISIENRHARGCGMDSKLNFGKLAFEYDRIGDILYISKCPVYPEQESTEISSGVVARLNPESQEVENLEILWFSRRMQQGESLELPIEVDWRLAIAA
jgi:hypothetical protein